MKFPCTCLVLAAALVAATGCGRQKEITPLERKQAANLVSEADFALTMRDWARAEGLLAQATAITPDEGPLWVTLGTTRMRLNQKDGARAAYNQALKAFEQAAKRTEADAAPMLQQIYVLVLLGRADEARKQQDKMLARFPNDRNVKAFVDGKQIDRLLSDPQVKHVSL